MEGENGKGKKGIPLSYDVIVQKMRAAAETEPPITESVVGMVGRVASVLLDANRELHNVAAKRYAEMNPLQQQRYLPPLQYEGSRCALAMSWLFVFTTSYASIKLATQSPEAVGRKRDRLDV